MKAKLLVQFYLYYSTCLTQKSSGLIHGNEFQN